MIDSCRYHCTTNRESDDVVAALDQSALELKAPVSLYDADTTSDEVSIEAEVEEREFFFARIQKN